MPASEATTCRAAIRAAKSVVEDIGEDSAAKSSGLLDVARCSLTHSERDVNVAARRYKVLLPIKLSALPKHPGLRYTGDFLGISLRDWCKFIVDYNCWHVLVGLKNPNAQRERDILSEFWRRFKVVCPEHEIWAEISRYNVDVSRCAPILLHGDEGRGKKKAPFLIAAYHSMIGFGTNLANQNRKHRPYLQMRLNYSENTNVHRFLTAVLPKMLKDEVALQTIFQFIVDDCTHMLRCGVQSCHGEKFHMSVLNCTGDWAWLAKAGNLSRSYSNVEKRPRGLRSLPKGICHYCHAGQAGMPFEDFRPSPVWKITCFVPGDNPFLERPLLLDIAHDPSREASFFVFDLWHSFHLGMGKTFVASAFALISDRMSATNIDGRFQELTDEFLQFCDETRVTPYVHSITKESCGWPDRSTYPNGFWSKGHVTSSFIKFIAHWLRKHDVSDSRMLTLVGEAVDCINQSIEELYSADLWLEQPVAHRIGHRGLRFVELYGQLAQMAFEEGVALWVLMPKGHVVHHTFLDLVQAGDWTINPLAHAVQMSEDYVGKKARLARRVGATQVIRRVLERSLQVAYKHWTEAGFYKG